MRENQYARFPRAKLLRRLIAVQDELNEWSEAYAYRASRQVYGHLHALAVERSNYLDHIWHELEPARRSLEDMR